jgi:Fe-S-cluster-containing dehydrogenase component
MARYRIIQNIADCIGCRACEVHCKEKNQTGPGIFYCRIVEKVSVSGGRTNMKWRYTSCKHCDAAWCVDACPNGAMMQREQDGIIFVDTAMCIGCEICVEACPWGIPQLDPDSETVIKCDLCKDRIDAGLEPACVSKCTTGCLRLAVDE